jgi:AraC-like DNA-binding protein
LNSPRAPAAPLSVIRLGATSPAALIRRFKKMTGSITSAFSEPEDFAAALRGEGCAVLLITGRGEFRAQLTQVTLHHLRLSAAEEQLSRIAFVAAPADTLVISFPIGSGTLPICGGTGLQPDEMMILTSGEQVHMRTNGVSRWGNFQVPVRELVRYGSALTGAAFTVPPVAGCWQPAAVAGRRLRSLHAAAIRMAQTRPQAFVDARTAHGLEQELIHGLIECLSAVAAAKDTSAARRHREIMVGFEDLIQIHSERNPRMSEICLELDVSNRQLRSLCAQHLGMSGSGYIRLGRMSVVRRTLRHADRDTATVSEIARRSGFRDLSRFAANYRGAFGELPSATLQRGSGRKLVELRLQRTHQR